MTAEQNNNQENQENPNTDNGQQEQRKYAGKFDSVEDLEAGYNNAAKVYQENEDLKKKLEESGKVPEDYLTPEGLELDENDLADLRDTAKHAQLTQSAFDRLAATQANKKKASQAKYQEARQAMSDEDYNVLESYVKKNYAAPLVDSTLRKLVVDGEARKAAMQHRESILNGTITGVGKTGGHAGYHITKNDLMESSKRVSKARTGKDKLEAQQKHISLTRQYAAQKRQANS